MAERAGAVVLGPGPRPRPRARRSSRAAWPRAVRGAAARGRRRAERPRRAARAAPRARRPDRAHPARGELGRLLGVEPDEVAAHRVEHVREAAERSGAVVLLKGDDTIVALPGGPLAISPGGTPGARHRRHRRRAVRPDRRAPGEGAGRRSRRPRSARSRTRSRAAHAAERVGAGPRDGGRRDRGASARLTLALSRPSVRSRPWQSWSARSWTADPVHGRAPETSVRGRGRGAARAPAAGPCRWWIPRAPFGASSPRPTSCLPDDEGDLHIPHYINLFGGTVFLEPLSRFGDRLRKAFAANAGRHDDPRRRPVGPGHHRARGRSSHPRDAATIAFRWSQDGKLVGVVTRVDLLGALAA